MKVFRPYKRDYHSNALKICASKLSGKPDNMMERLLVMNKSILPKRSTKLQKFHPFDKCVDIHLYYGTLTQGFKRLSVGSALLYSINYSALPTMS